MSTEVGALHYDLNIDDKNLKSQLDRADKSVKNFGDSVAKQWQKSVDASKIFMASMLGLTAATVAFGVKSVNAFRESEAVMAQTEAVLKSTNNAAGVTVDTISTLAKEIQKTSKFTDEEVQSGENLLLTFTKIGKDVFPEATQTMVDMSAALGQDLKSSAVQLGKALNDPIQGVTALRRVGVSFTEQQLEQIEAMVKSGKTLEAQKFILKELKTEFGGSAKAASDAAGPMERIKDVWGDTQEVVGGLISKALDPLITRFGDWISKIDEAAIQNFIDNVLKWLQTNGDSLAGIIGGALAPAVLSLAGAFLVLSLRLAPFMALGLVIANFDELIQKFQQLNPFIQGAIILIGTFATLLGGIFLVNMGRAVLATSAMNGTLGTVKLAFSAFATVISSPLVMPALVVAAALASLYEVKKAADAVKGAVEAANNAALAAENLAPEGQMRELQKKAAEARARGDTAAVNRYANALRALGGGTRASGGPVSAGAPYMTGEEGRELFVPSTNGFILPNKLTETLMRGFGKRGGDMVVNIGTIEDRSDADYVINRLDRDIQLLSMGGAPQ